jgi:fatty-acyl-CoA synthase
VGAETIRPQTLSRFAEAFAPSGFDPKAFLACYGLAECTLGVSFGRLDRPVEIDCVDADVLAKERRAQPLDAGEENGTPARASLFVTCGAPLPGIEVVVRDEDGRPAPDRRCGTLFVRGSAVMSGYFRDPAATAEVLGADGWLNTGDVAYRIGDSIVITGRERDLIVVNGRNIWPEDIEYLAEQQPGIRPGDASAFSVPRPEGGEVAVVVIQCRHTDAHRRRRLVETLRALVREELGIECVIELVPPHTLSRTSSGKLSRSRTRDEFLRRTAWGEAARPSVPTDPFVLEQASGA